MFTSQIFLYRFQPEIDSDCSFAASNQPGGNKQPDQTMYRNRAWQDDKIMVSNYKSLVWCAYGLTFQFIL